MSGIKYLLLGVVLLTGCPSKKDTPKESQQETYTQPNGPTSGIAKVLSHSDDWVWFEFLSNHQVKEYQICGYSDQVITGMVGEISLGWDRDGGCFNISTFLRRQELEDK